MDDLLSFIPELVRMPGKPTEFWNILIVDDEQSVHDVTLFALKGFVFEDKALQFHSAFSAQEAIELLRTQADFFQVLLLDIVMEHRNAGIEVINFLRNELKNSTLQIVVRTGNPGLAPEDYLVHHYEINDYEEKNGLTVQRLKTSLTAALRAYQNIETIQHIVANKIAELQALRQTLRQVTFAPNHTVSSISGWVAPISLPVFLRNPVPHFKQAAVVGPIPVHTSDIGMSLQFMQEKIAATTRKAIAIFDYSTNDFRYVSENIKEVTGFSWNEMIQKLQTGGHYSPDTHKIDRVNKQLTKLYTEANNPEKAQFTAIFDYRLTLVPPHNVRILEYISPLLFDENGNLLLSLHVYSNINHLKKADANSILAVHIANQNHYFSISDYRMDEIFFGPREQEIMEYSDKNLLSKEIAQAINLSVHTVDTHLRNLRDRLGVISTNALISYSKEITHLFGR